MRSAIIPLLTFMLSGCAYMPTDVTRIQMTARDGGTVYYGTVKREPESILNITVEVDRRIYTGNFELTRPNATYGLYRVYGPRDGTLTAAPPAGGTNYAKAILSSSDRRILRCDFTDNLGKEAYGLCIDEWSRVYDVTLS